MEIGGFFPYEDTEERENGYIEGLCPDAGDVKHLMSGRCAIYFCLQDALLADKNKAFASEARTKTAYLPSYTCETVLSCFVKADYEILYYDVNENLVPEFDEAVIPRIGFLLICGYYGFTTFDRTFVKKCRDQGITVMQDLTHTAFSVRDICEDTDYLVVSLRKWMGVISGGIAIKRVGQFGVTPVLRDEEHLGIRKSALAARRKYEETEDEQEKKESYDAFWKAEFMLRKIFDMQEGDEKSLYDMQHYPLKEAIEKRRKNYQWLLQHLPQKKTVKVIFPVLPETVCPMFFAFLCENRESLMQHLAERQIPPKIYWSVPPFIEVDNYKGARNIYGHIMSVSCDQRFTIADMKKIVKAIESYQE